MNTNQPVAVIAGASRGLGLLVARNLARRGYVVATLARGEEALQRSAQSAAHEGLTLRPYVVDVTDHNALSGTIERVEAELGPIEVAIHVAGIIQVGPLSATTREHFEQAIDVMLWGPINLALAVIPGMWARRSGHFGTVASVGGVVSVPHLLPYSTAKFGAVGFAEGLAAELAGTGVTSTTILPGLMRTGSHLQAQFIGDVGLEYAWFAPGASLPLISMNAERAAEKMVDAVLAGKAVLALSPLTKIAMRVHGMAPATTVHALGVLNRVLPGPRGQAQDGTVLGIEARKQLRQRHPRVARMVRALTVLGDRAARRNNELAG